MAKSKNPIANPMNRKRKDFKTVRAYYDQVAKDNGFKNYRELSEHRGKTGLKDKQNRGRRPAKKQLKDGSYTQTLKFNNQNYDQQEEELDRMIKSAPKGSDIQIAFVGNVYKGVSHKTHKDFIKKSDWDWVGRIPEVKEQFLDDIPKGQSVLQFLRNEKGVRDVTFKNGQTSRGIDKVMVRIIPRKK